MSIKVEIKGSLESKEAISYPCVMISSNGPIVLFKWKGAGTLLGYTDRWPKELEKQVIGHFTPEWNMSKFTPYTGEITIESTPFNNRMPTYEIDMSMSYRVDHTKENKSNTPKSINIEAIKYKTSITFLGKKSLTVCNYMFLDCKVGSGTCQGCPHFHDIDKDQSIVYCKYKGLHK